MINVPEIVLKNFKNEIEDLLDNNSILAIDLFYVHNFSEYTSKSFTLYRNNYVNHILFPFLKKYGTLGASDSVLNNYKNYGDDIANLENKNAPCDFLELSEVVVNRKQSTFEEMVNHLKSHNFGQFAYWHNSFIEHENSKLNISVFFILNRKIKNIENKVNQFNSLVFKYLMPEIHKIILSTSVSLAKELVISQKRANYFQKLTTEFRSHTHVLNMFDPISTLDTALLKVNSKDNSELYYLIKEAYLHSFFRNIYIGLINKRGKYYDYAKSISSINKILSLIKSENNKLLENSNNINIQIEYKGEKDYKIDEKSIIDLMTIILNLWSNAVKHSKNGQCQIIVNNVIQDKYSLDFINSGEIKKEYIDFIFNGSDCPKGNRCFGLRDIKKIIKNHPINLELVNDKNPVKFKLNFES